MEHLKQSYFTNGIRFSDLFGGGWGVCPSTVSLSHKLITRVGFTSPLSQIWFFLIRFCHFHIDQKQVSLQRRNRDWVICVVIKYSNWGGKKYQQNLDLIAKSSYSSSQAFSEQNYYPHWIGTLWLTIFWPSGEMMNHTLQRSCELTYLLLQWPLISIAQNYS